MRKNNYATRPLTPHEKSLYQSKLEQYSLQWAKHPTVYFLRNTLNDVKQILRDNALPTFERLLD